MSLFGKKDAELERQLKSASEDLENYLADRSFKEPADVRSKLKDYDSLYKKADKNTEGLLSKLGFGNRDVKVLSHRFKNKYSTFETDCIERNKELAQEAYNADDKLCPVEGRTLDGEQMEAIYTDVNTRLILSGAGSGKTTTIVGFAKHLFNMGIEPEKVQFISFTNNSVSELRIRIRKETGQEADVKTFHRLGLRIISESGGIKPHITHIDLRDFIYRYLNDRKNDRSFKTKLARYTMMYQYKQEDDIDRDRREFLEKYSFIAADGTAVRSNGELDVANHLYFMGIPYTYEDDYKVDTSDCEHSQYHPDFHIKGTDVYIEFFGTDRHGNVAVQMEETNPDASADYNNAIKWKREIHKKYGTVMIELYSYQRSEGNLFEILDRELEKNGIHPGEIDTDDAFINQFGSTERAFKKLSGEFATSISLIEGTGKNWSQAYPCGRNPHERSTLRVLESILEPIYTEYRRALSVKQEIDFQDMLVMATETVKKGSYKPELSYMVVDEYQDISPAAYNLLKAMRDVNHYKLFCVGDDWQSIYRFNGSDVVYIMDFEKYWGPSCICLINRTYRYSGRLLSMSSDFIMANPRQIKKRVKGPPDRDTAVIPLLGKSRDDMASEILETVSKIPNGEDVLMIGRYHHDIMFLENQGFTWHKDTFSDSLIVRCEPRPDLKIEYRTAHASKGLQADNVFILNNRRGKGGFPSETAESPLISLMLDENSCKEDDERRLYYVAMTRAKKRLFLAIPQNCKERSPYISELFPPRECPQCGGRLVLRKGRYGYFYGCSNYGRTGCKYKEEASFEI